MVAPTHNRPDTEIVVVMVVMPPLDGHRGIIGSDGGGASLETHTDCIVVVGH